MSGCMHKRMHARNKQKDPLLSEAGAFLPRFDRMEMTSPGNHVSGSVCFLDWHLYNFTMCISC